MLRKVLIALGLLVAILPYLGFPQAWDMTMSTAAGLSIVFLVLISRRGKRQAAEQEDDVSLDTPRALHVEHTEVEDRPSMHIERETIVDTERLEESPDTETTVEKKVTVVRRRKRKPTDEIGPPSIENT